MHIGMLWFDNDPKSTLEVKIEQAAKYYLNKYTRTPTLCYVNPSMLTQEQATEKLVLAGLEIKSSQSVLPNHFWIGVG